MATATLAGQEKALVSRGHARLLLTASVFTCLLITMGGVVCATESGAACPDWPGCFGRVVPPLQYNAVIEYTHRFIAALTTPLIVAAAVLGWMRTPSIRWVSRPPALATLFVLAVVVFGALAVLRGLPPGLAAVDLGSALVVGALLLTATVVAYAHRSEPGLPDRLSLNSRYARLALVTLIAVWAVYDSAVLVAGPGSHTRCVSWPILSMVPVDLPGWPQFVRLFLAAVAAGSVVAVVAGARRTQTRHTALVRTSNLAGLALAVEMVVGVLLLLAGPSTLLRILYVAAAVGLWAALVVVLVLAALPSAEASVSTAAPG